MGGHAGHYLDIESFPGNAADGSGTYTVGSNVCVNFGFKRTPSGSRFDAWYENAPDSGFVLTPLREGSGNNISGFCMAFPDLPKFLAKFGIDQTAQDPKKVKAARRLDPLPEPIELTTHALFKFKRTQKCSKQDSEHLSAARMPREARRLSKHALTKWKLQKQLTHTDTSASAAKKL